MRGLAERRGLSYEEVGGINPRDAPPALCPGGSNRLTGELHDGFWGACCDAAEHEEGSLLGGRAILPGALLVKAHMPELTGVVPAFDVESIEATPAEQLRRLSRLRVEFESVEFNRRFLATVPEGHDPIALRELFSPSLLDWATTIDREVDFGASERQLYLLWRLRELTGAELELALAAAARLFQRLHAELREGGATTHPPGPWNAGQAAFPA